MQNKAIHIIHCPTEEMVADFFTKPLQCSLFTKVRNHVMGNEEPGYQVLPRSVGKQQQCNHSEAENHWHLEAQLGSCQNHETCQRFGCFKYPSSKKNTQGTSSGMGGNGDERMNHPGQSGGRAEQHGDVNRNVEPRSYRDVVVNG